MPTRLTAACFILILLASCASPAPTSTPTPAHTRTASASSTPSQAPTLTDTPQPTLAADPASLRGVTIRAWHAFAGSAYDTFARQMERFNASNEWGIKVEQAGYGDYASLFDAVTAALVSGAAPELVSALPEQALAWDRSVVNLAPYLADPRAGLDSASLADIPPVFLSQDEAGGRVMGLPAQRSARYLLYNRSWARQLGFNAPPATSAEFRAQACAANASFKQDSDPANDGYGGWLVDTDWQAAYSWILAFDGSVADAGAYTFRTDPNLSALEFLKKLYDDHCAWLAAEPNPPDSFSRRTALFAGADLGSLRDVTAAMTSRKNADDWTVIPFPGPQGQALVAYGPSYTVLKSTPEKQLAAWLFIKFLLSPENQAEWVQATGLLPLRSSSLPMLSAFRASLPQWDAAVSALDAARLVPQLASWRKVRYVLQDGLDTIFQQNTPVSQLPGILMEMDTLAEELNK